MGRYINQDFSAAPEAYIRYWVEKVKPIDPKVRELKKALRKFAEQEGYLEKWAKEDWLYKVGDRENFFLRCDHVESRRSSYNYGGVASFYYLNHCTTRDGHLVVYSGSKKWIVGSYYDVIATVKSHRNNFDDGRKVTYITRPRVLNVLEPNDEEKS
jgi:hypothetical protein